MKSLYHLTSAGAVQTFTAAISLQTLIPFLPLPVNGKLVRLPEPGSIYRLNTGSYGITVTL